MMEHILILDPSPQEINTILSKEFRVHHATHPYEIKSLISDLAAIGQKISILLCSVRNYHPRIFSSWTDALSIPRLILIRSKLDKMAPAPFKDPIGYWKYPYKIQDFKNLLLTTIHQCDEDRERIHLMINRRITAIPVAHILLIKKQPPGQVLIYTTEGDHLVNANLKTIESLLPDLSMERISDQLLVPYGSQKKISKNGYPFRGGYIPIQDRYLKTRRKVMFEEEIIG